MAVPAGATLSAAAASAVPAGASASAGSANAAAAPAPAPAAPAAAAAGLLSAPVLPTLLRLAGPNMVAMVGTALAAICETLYVGQLGVPALAGMAMVFPLLMLQQMLSGGAMGSGVSSTVSRALGAGDLARAEALAVHALAIALIGGLVSSVLMLGFGDGIYAALGARGAALDEAVAYSHVAFTGSVGVWLLNTLAALLRATGQMSVPSATMIGVAVLQVLLAGVLGLGLGPVPRLGMPGIAAGQVIAYAAGAAVLGWFLLSGRARIRLPWRQTRWQRALFRDLLRLGALACVSPVQTVATILILTHLVARFGPATLAGYGIGTRLEFLLIPLAFSFGVASVPLIGAAIGARRPQRARQAAWTAGGLAAGLLGSTGLVLAVVPQLWTTRFTTDAAVIAAANTYFHWAGPGYALFGIGLSLYFSSIGANRVGPVLAAGTLRLLIVAIGGWVLVQLGTPAWSIFALVAAAMVAYGLASVLLVRRTPWGPDGA